MELQAFDIYGISDEDAMKIIDDYLHQGGYLHFMNQIKESLKENNQYVD